jgi:predicted RNA binding protein YcfA (HicA-like mRNA interferase family)
MSPVAPGFPSMKARRFRRLLERELDYSVTRNKGGSHRILESPNHPRLVFAFHDGDEVGPALIRRILVKDVGLSLERAKEVVSRG